MQEAIEFEVRRQIELIEDGGTVVQETRLYDPDKRETRSMRSKEDAQDYRYFPDPDLPPLVIDEPWIDRIRAEMPELPEAKRQRLSSASYNAAAHRCGQPHGVAGACAQVFEATVRAGVDPRLAANWILGEFSAATNKADIDPAERAGFRAATWARC